MSEYGNVEYTSIAGSLDGYYRVLTEEESGMIHEFRVPFSVLHGPDRFRVDFEFKNVMHEYGEPEEENQVEHIECPEQIKLLANEARQDILRKADV